MANEISITGVVQFIGERIDTGNFSKRDIVIRTDEQYPQDIAVQFTQDKCDLLDIYKVGEQVTIWYNLRGKVGGWVNPQGETKYFTTVQGWKIQRTAGQAATNPSAPATPTPPAAPVKKYVHTDTQYTEAQYLATPGWTHEVLVSKGKGNWEIDTRTQSPAMPPAAGAPAPDQDLPFN